MTTDHSIDAIQVSDLTAKGSIILHVDPARLENPRLRHRGRSLDATS